MTQAIDSRRYDVDWLRTLAFGLLILYHVGMYYVADWDWHIKSAVQSVWLQDLMLLTNQWRMSLLFFISGIALAMVKDKFSTWQLVNIRSQRLLVPLIFGMLVIVPPQLYFELLGHQQFGGSYLAFMQEYLNLHTTLAPNKQSAIGLLTWNHLWFLPYLWCYSLIVVVLYPLLKKLLHFPLLQKLPLWLGFISLVVSLVIIGLCLQDYPSTHALTNDWFLHGIYFTVFISGMALPNLPSLWQKIIAKRRWFAILALLGYCWLVLDRHGMLDVGEELDGLVVIKFIHAMLLSTNHWAWIFALLGYAGRYLQFSNSFLRYANQAILPWYILHQTLIILFAMSLKSLNIPATVEASILILLTSLGCWLGYEVIRRIKLTSWLFGLKLTAKEEIKKDRANQEALSTN
jgi:glucans biosynthesis protein C